MGNPHGPAQCAAEIILPKGRLGLIEVVVEPILGVKETIPQVVVGSAVPLIGARFRLEGELTAGIPPVFRRVRGTLYPQLLESIHGDSCLRGAQGGRCAERAASTRNHPRLPISRPSRP